MIARCLPERELGAYICAEHPLCWTEEELWPRDVRGVMTDGRYVGIVITPVPVQLLSEPRTVPPAWYASCKGSGIRILDTE